MTSSNQERENSQTQSSASTEKHPDPPPQTSPYPTHPPPHPMYYPNHPYPQYPNGYPAGYPGPAGYHYPQTAPYYGPPATYQTSSAGSRFYRSFIICSCVILTGFFIMSLALALVLHPQLPSYQVVSLSVTNFSTTSTTLLGKWEAKFTVENPNEKLVAYFSDFRVNVAYKDDVVAVIRAPSFVLNTKDKVDLDVTDLSNHMTGAMLEKETMDDFVKERVTGSVTFSLRVSSATMFKSGSFSTRSEDIVGLCEELKVAFQNNNATTGTMDTKGKPMECQIYI